MSTYKVYNEYYSGYNEQDLSSIDFVEVDLTSGICMTHSLFDDTPRDIQIDADSIFTSQPKPDVVDNSDLLNISSDTSTLMQGSCLDLFNNKADKFEDFKIREPEHTSPAKLEKQRRIEEYHKRHNRKRNR